MKYFTRLAACALLAAFLPLGISPCFVDLQAKDQAPSSPTNFKFLLLSEDDGVLPGVQVEVSSADGKLSETLTSDDKGHVRLFVQKDIKPETLAVTFVTPTGEKLTGSVTIDPVLIAYARRFEPFAALPVQVQAIATTGSVTFVDAADKPLANMPVHVEGFLGSQNLSTDAAGEVPVESINKLLPYRVKFTGPDNAAYLGWEHHRDIKRPRVAIPPVGKTDRPVIQGQVLDESGKPVPGVLVSAFPIPSEDTQNEIVFTAPIHVGVFTDAQGKFRFSPAWDFQVSPDNSPPAKWVISAYASVEQNLGPAASFWQAPGEQAGAQAKANAKDLTLTLPKLSAVLVDYKPAAREQKPGARKRVEGMPAALARLTDDKKIQIIVGMIQVGEQTLPLAPGQYQVLANRFQSSAAQTLAPGQTRFDLTLENKQTIRFTFAERQTGKPIQGGFVTLTAPLAFVSELDAEGWKKFASQPPPNQDAVMDYYMTVLHTDPSDKEGAVTVKINPPSPPPIYVVSAYAQGYVPANISNDLAWTRPDAQGVIQCAIKLDPAARLRVLVEKPPAKTAVNPPRLHMAPMAQADPTLESYYFSKLFINSSSGELPPQGMTILVPKGMPQWFVAHADTYQSAGTFGPDSTTTIWMSDKPVVADSLDPVDVVLKPRNTVAWNVKVVNAAGKPLVTRPVYCRPAGTGYAFSNSITNEEGEARFYLPSGIKFEFRIHTSLDANPSEKPVWIATIPQAQDPEKPFVITVAP